MQEPAATACVILIGDEVLSGRTQDRNLAWLARELNENGIRLAEGRVVPDDEAAIIEAVNGCRRRFTYVFTTGGIGPTHDDITSAAVAKAFGVKLERNPEAEAMLRGHYGSEQLNAARLKMADIPAGAELIANPISAAPGFRMENVYVMAGVPSIMQAMFHNVRHQLEGGKKMLSKAVSAHITEGMIAERLGEIQRRHAQVSIGSYPFSEGEKLGVTLISRSTDAAALDLAHGELKKLLLSVTPDVVEEDLAGRSATDWGDAYRKNRRPETAPLRA